MPEIEFPLEIENIVTAAAIDYIMPGQVSLVSKYTGSESIISSGEGYFSGALTFGPTSGGVDEEAAEVFLSRLRGRANTVKIPTFRRVYPYTVVIAKVNKAKRTVVVNAPVDGEGATIADPPALSAFIGAFFTVGEGTRVVRIMDVSGDNGRTLELEPYLPTLKANTGLSPASEILTRSVNASTGQMPRTPDFKGPWLYQWREVF